MREEKLLTIRDAALILGVTEKEVMDLAENGSIPAYKVAGVYLRFKREQVEEFKKKFYTPAQRDILAQKYSVKDKISDFFYFNDFYILSILLIILMLVIIFRSF